MRARLHEFVSQEPGRTRRLGGDVPGGDRPVTAAPGDRRRPAGVMTWLRRHPTMTAYLLLAPGMLYLAVFYALPTVQMFLVSLWTGSIQQGYEQTWNFAIYPEAFGEVRRGVPALDALRRRGDPAHVRARLPARVLHRVPGRPLQDPAAVPGHRAVLHQLPAADHQLEDHPRGQRHALRAAQGPGPAARGVPACSRRRSRSSRASPTTSCRS